MDIRKLQRAIVDGLEDVKAQNIVVFNTEALSPLFERVIVASGTSNRQTKALASSVRDAVKAGGMQVLRSEGEANGEWIIVDCGAAVVHVMQPSVREYYRLEEIWGGKPVGMKIGRPDRAPEKPAGAKKPALRSDGAKTLAAPARKRPATRPAAVAEKPDFKKPAAKKLAAKKSAGSKSTGSKPAAKKVAANRPAARKSAIKKPAARKTAPARKAPAAPRAAPRKTSRA